MYLPIVEATKDIEILTRTMKIICESILENIYNKQIKFTVCGALNLLKDFEGIAEWIESNKEVPEAFREKLMKHEVLKYCEGVGKILLREPDEVISMFPSPTKAKRMASTAADEGEKLEAINIAEIEFGHFFFFNHEQTKLNCLRRCSFRTRRGGYRSAQKDQESLACVPASTPS